MGPARPSGPAASHQPIHHRRSRRSTSGITDFDNGARPVTASRAGLHCRGVTPEAQRAESFLRLQQFLARDVLRYSPFYRRKFAAVGLTADDIRSEADFAAKVPYTTKDELREHHPDFVL
jgi:hypothetical protein